MAEAPGSSSARGRPPGITSRLAAAPGRRHPWSPEPGVTLDLPVTLDVVWVDPVSGERGWSVQATVDLVGGQPAVTEVRVDAPHGLDLVHLQRDFRWATPLEAVTRLAPQMIAEGLDPLDQDFPFTGFPEVAHARTETRHVLSDDFLEDVAREYLALGRGYATALASRYQVEPRTVVSWVEKARRRGILTAAGRGRHGGDLVPRRQRPSSS